MPSYILPQVVINQLFSEVPLNTIKNQNCLVFGPQFELFKYSDSRTHDIIHLGKYNGLHVVDDSGIENDNNKFEYPGQQPNSRVDTSFTRLIADNAVVEIAKLEGFEKLEDDVSGADLDGRIKFNVNIAGKHKSATLPRDIEVGDVLRISYDVDKIFQSKVIEVFASDKFSPDYVDSVRIEDTFPTDFPMDQPVDSNDLPSFGGDVVVCASVQNVEVPRKATTPGDWQWTSKEEEFTIDATGNLTIPYLGEDKNIIEADLYLEYRTFMLANSDTIHSIERSSDVVTNIGEDTPENPLAFAVKKCVQNSADRVVYYMATTGDSLADYEKVLTAASRTDKVYFLIPLSQEDDVIDALKAHVEEMSKGSNKLWRVGFVSPKVPETNVLYTKAASTDGEGFFAVFEAPTGDKKAGNVIMRFVSAEGAGSDSPSTATKCASQVVPGDKVRLYTGEFDKWTFEPVYNTYDVDKVLSNTVLRLKTGPSEAIANGKRVEVVHSYTYAEKAEMIAATSRALFSRRVYSVFPPQARESDGTTYNGVHLAAASAGLASSVLPQQPITNIELTGIDDVPMCYETFSREQLNTIAAGGTFIVMQDLPGDRVYIRHQISTEYSGNNLLKSELSITKNIDSISYYFAEAYKPFIGRYNITPGLLEVLRSVAENALTKLESETGAGLYGPQVLPEGTEITSLEQDQVNQDHVKMHLKLNLPRPFNVLDLDLEVI